MKQYLNLLHDILKHGQPKNDRTGVGTISVFGRQLRFNLQQGFPIVTTKRVHFKSVVHELLWFISGDTNTKYLEDNGVTIWREWQDEKGDLGPIYGAQWRRAFAYKNLWFGEKTKIDQLGEAIDQIKQNPNSRRIIVSCWNLSDLNDMALYPCHVMFQFEVCNKRLSCQVYIRSSDVFLGLPFNIASYALLTNMVAAVTQLAVGDLVIATGDTHLYKTHLTQAQKQLKREPRPLPRLELPAWAHYKGACIDDIKYSDIKLINYDPHEAINAEVAV